MIEAAAKRKKARLVSAAGSTITTIAFRELAATASGLRVGLYVLALVGGWLVTVCGALFSLIVMGGATRNLVSHLISNEPVSVRTTYRAVKTRFWSLLGASILVAIWLMCSAMVASLASGMLSLIVIFAIVLGSVVSPWLTVIIGGLGATVAIIGGLIIFFMLAGRLAYVPQAMLVEGRGVFSAVNRSLALASGNVRRLMAMTLFTFFATYSALMLLMIPLGWYGYLNGVDLSPLGNTWPTWYAIGYQVILQCSHITLAPIWMLGLSLLYVDERVRHEGYDIELMAARQLPDHKGAVQLCAKPFAELPAIRQRPPDPRNRGLQFDFLFNGVIHIGNSCVAYK
jgi:hypothetical protein